MNNAQNLEQKEQLHLIVSLILEFLHVEMFSMVSFSDFNEFIFKVVKDDEENTFSLEHTECTDEEFKDNAFLLIHKFFELIDSDEHVFTYNDENSLNLMKIKLDENGSIIPSFLMDVREKFTNHMNGTDE